MNLLKEKDLKTLIQHSEYPSISVYLPTHIAGRDVREDPIRLKNLLNSCQAKLGSEWKSEKVAKFLKPGYDILKDSLFWKHQRNGLALFISSNYSKYFRLPLAPEQKLYIGTSFYILPLIPILFMDKPFYILIFNQSRTKLFKATYNIINEIEIPEMPKSIDEILQYDVREEYIQLCTMPSRKTSGTDAIFHGQGDIADDARRKKNLERFIREVAKGIDRQLQEQKTPLLLVGVEYEQAFYRQFASYSHILTKGISINSAQFDIKKIHHKSLEIMQPYFNKEIENCLTNYRNLLKTGRTSSDIKEIVQFAFTGRVDTLLIDINEQIQGEFDPESQHVELGERGLNHNPDLLNLSAIYSLKNGAAVCPIKKDFLPDHSPLAAVYRY